MYDTYLILLFFFYSLSRTFKPDSYLRENIDPLSTAKSPQNNPKPISLPAPTRSHGRPLWHLRWSLGRLPQAARGSGGEVRKWNRCKEVSVTQRDQTFFAEVARFCWKSRKLLIKGFEKNHNCFNFYHKEVKKYCKCTLEKNNNCNFLPCSCLVTLVWPGCLYENKKEVA